MPQYYEQEVIDLIKYGQTIREIIDITGHARESIRKIVRHYNLEVREPFGLKCDGVYLVRLSNLRFWGIEASGTEVATRAANKMGVELIAGKYYWGDLRKGDQFMIADNNAEIFVK